MKVFLFIIALTFLSGCKLTDSFVLVSKEVSAVNDVILLASIYEICNGVETGAIKRYFNTVKLKIAREWICENAGDKS